jgi:hypothetical protein
MSHLLKLWFERPSKHDAPTQRNPLRHLPQSFEWFIVTDDPERLLRACAEALAYRCHPNDEFQRGFDICVQSVGRLGFPPEIPYNQAGSAIEWTRCDPQHFTSNMGVCIPALRQFALRNMKHEHRATGTHHELTQQIESIVWLTGRQKGHGVPVICNAFARDNPAPEGHPSPVTRPGEITCEWAWEHPRVTTRETRLAHAIEERRQQLQDTLTSLDLPPISWQEADDPVPVEVLRPPE